MDRQGVQSSNVASVGYDPEEMVLEVEFVDGDVYQYDGVPASVYEGLMSAPSVGRYLHQMVKGRYDYSRA
jgi:hypothetical protein